MMPFRRTALRTHALLLSAVVLASCTTGPAASPTEPTSPPQPTSIPTATPTLTALPATPDTPTDVPRPATTPDPSLTSTLIALPTRTGAEQACMPPDANTEFPALAEPDVFSAPAAALEYLNQGGDPLRLEELMTRRIRERTDSFRSQVVSAELTGDAVPEISLALTFPFGPTSPSGDSTLVVFHCDQARYEMLTLFTRAGAGSGGEGLYAGRGVRVLGALDMNKNGRPDLVFASFWELDTGPYGEYRIGEWAGEEFRSLIHYFDILGTERRDIEAGREAEVKDVDGDGFLELVFPRARDPQNGEFISPAIYAWNGTTYELRGP